jgi:ABC-type multidrug transport system fused ATPase/permease subunit
MTNKNKIADFYHDTVYNFFNRFGGAKILEVDFKKPWWDVIWQQKLPIGFSVLFYTFQSILITLNPIIFSFLLTSNHFEWILYFIGFWIFLSIFQVWISYLFDLATIKSILSVELSAHKYFLTVDPIFHSTRSSGQIINKINKACGAYDPIFEIFTFSILNVVFGLITVVSAISFVDLKLGIITGICLTIMVVFSSWTEVVRNNVFEIRNIPIDDRLKSTLVENLAQNSMIRSSFATDLQLNKTIFDNTAVFKSTLASWNASSLNNILRRVIFWFFTSYLCFELFNMIKVGKMDAVVGAGLLVTYFAAYNSMAHIGGQIKNFLQSKTRITDLWKFVNEFGVQSFPVLEHSKKEILEGCGITATNLHFDYSELVKIFENHSLNLPYSQGLYGIIGPSGTGKTTLLSILGGQLKPTSGEIIVGKVNIYKIDDSQRRQLIGLQMQTATSLKGTLRNNLVFGLVTKDYPNDKVLETTLEQVGLWSLFKDKEGLETIIGEGGLNLSGGQRQRLNFAGLYLRNSVYHPKVLLIDEPTSSLDEISESSITDMIVEMSQKALTIVVAHRLKTLASAEGILDVSLLENNNNMEFWNHDELLKQSEYYKDLTTGKASLD